MNSLSRLLEEYITTRRVLGTKYHEPAKMLKHFVAFVEKQGSQCISTHVALQWATEPKQAQPARWAARLSMVRGFALYAQSVDARHQVPPHRLLPYKYQRQHPYIYNDVEVTGLIEAAKLLSPIGSLRPQTQATVIGLLAVTGMRVSEALNLNREDVDLRQGILTVRESKFGRTRILPLHWSSHQALRSYAAVRDRISRNHQGPAFFPSSRGARLPSRTVHWTFMELSRQIGLRARTDSHGPRLIDLRHTFAVNTLLRWYGDGVDVESRLGHLSSYLGHVRVSDTYWYLTATPQLMKLAAERADHVARSM